MSLLLGEVHCTAKKTSAPHGRELHYVRRAKLVTVDHR